MNTVLSSLADFVFMLTELCTLRLNFKMRFMHTSHTHVLNDSIDSEIRNAE